LGPPFGEGAWLQIQLSHFMILNYNWNINYLKQQESKACIQTSSVHNLIVKEIV